MEVWLEDGSIEHMEKTCCCSWYKFDNCQESLCTNLLPLRFETKANSCCGSLERKPTYFRLISVAEPKAEKNWRLENSYLCTYMSVDIMGLLPGNQAVATIILPDCNTKYSRIKFQKV